MNYYSLLPFVGLIANLLLAFYVISIDPKSRENRLFFLFAMTLAFWCGSKFMVFSAPNAVWALFWTHFGTWGSGFSAVFVLHFLLVYTRVPMTGLKKSILIVIYMLALAFSLLDQTASLIDSLPEYHYWGFSPPPGPLYVVFSMYVIVCTGSGLLLAVRYYLRAASERDSKQAKLLILAIAIPLTGGVMTEAVPTVFDLEILPLTSVLTTVMAGVLGYTIRRYKLLAPLEDQLKTAEEKYEKLFNTIPDPIALISEDGCILEVNSALMDLLAESREAAIGKHLSNWLPEAVAQHRMRRVRQALATGTIRESEDQTGGRYYHNLFVPTWHFTEKVILLISRDITQSKRVEQTLREKEQSLSEIIEGSPIATYVLDRDHRVTHWNQTLVALAGISARRMIGTQDHWRAFYEEEQPVIADLLLGDRQDLLDLYYKNKYRPAMLPGAFEARDFFPKLGEEGRWLYFTACPLRDNCGNITGAVTTLQDITGRRAAEDELRASEEKFRILAENANDIIWTTDINFVLTYISPSVERLTGFSPEVTLHQPADRHLPPQSQKLAREKFEEIMGREARGDRVTESQVVELEHYCADGSIILVEASIALLRDKEGNPTGVTGLSRDITERKESERELEAAKKQAEAANEAKSQFLANMSHEIRTPMNGILGMAELLADTELGREQKEYVDIICNSANSLLEIINDILDVSSIEAGRMKIQPEPFNLEETVAGVRNILNYTAESKGLSLRLEYDAPAWVVGDRKRIRQILMNLAGNAVKFTSEGEVSISVSYDRQQSVFIFVVSDTGIGIPKPHQNEIFNLFQQVDSGKTRKFEGTGLGLTISKNLTEMMNGEIFVESEEGRGSAFTVRLPLQTCQPNGDSEPEAEESASPEADGPVLVVEDNPASLMLVEQMLTKDGWRVETAEDGYQALEKLKAGRFMAIFLDIHMSGMDGFELTRKIRQKDAGGADPGIYIIAMTANALPENRDRCLEAGMDDYITKPVNIRMLRQALFRACS